MRQKSETRATTAGRIERGGGNGGETVRSPPGQNEISLAVRLISDSHNGCGLLVERYCVLATPRDFRSGHTSPKLQMRNDMSLLCTASASWTDPPPRSGPT